MNTTHLTGPVKLIWASWSFYKQHAMKLTRVMFWPLVCLFVSSLLIGAANTFPSAALVLGIIGVLVAIASVIFAIASTNALIRSVDVLVKDPAAAPSLGSLYRFGFSYFWPLVLVAIIRGIAMGGSMMLFVVPGIMFAVYSIFCVYALVLDDKRGLAAFTESFAVVRGHWWPVLGRVLWLMLWYLIGFMILGGVEFILRVVFGYGINSLANSFVTGVLNTLFSLVFVPFAMTYFYKLYAELRAARMAGDTRTFRQWLIAFIVLGVLAILFFVASGVLLSRNSPHVRIVPGQSVLIQTSDGNLVK